MSEDKVIYDKSGQPRAFIGHDATKMYQAAVLLTGIGLMSKGIKPSRGWTMKGALARAEEFTGRKYKRTEWAQARADLKIWVMTMKSALPSETEPYDRDGYGTGSDGW
jgi:hypothetical protein